MPTSLILPVAADKEEYKGEMPYLFRLDRKGIMICLAAIKGLELDKFDGVYITILKKHNDIYKLEDLLDLQFRRLGIADKAHVVELETPTKSQPETVYMTIKKCAIKDGVFVKEADSYFETEMSVENSVCIYPLDYLNRVNPQNKSYVNVDDMYYITNIIEKRILGRDFSAGGYFFENADDFCTLYEDLSDYAPIYMSHIIYAALLKGMNFRPLKVKDYKDWGTYKDWRDNE